MGLSVMWYISLSAYLLVESTTVRGNSSLIVNSPVGVFWIPHHANEPHQSCVQQAVTNQQCDLTSLPIWKNGFYTSFNSKYNALSKWLARSQWKFQIYASAPGSCETKWVILEGREFDLWSQLLQNHGVALLSRWVGEVCIPLLWVSADNVW